MAGRRWGTLLGGSAATRAIVVWPWDSADGWIAGLTCVCHCGESGAVGCSDDSGGNTSTCLLCGDHAVVGHACMSRSPQETLGSGPRSSCWVSAHRAVATAFSESSKKLATRPFSAVSVLLLVSGWTVSNLCAGAQPFEGAHAGLDGKDTRTT